ncbi:MAG: hypothetical protein PVI09_08020 [Anaerolineae bacterium]|jgi:hypothetical protein
MDAWDLWDDWEEMDEFDEFGELEDFHNRLLRVSMALSELVFLSDPEAALADLDSYQIDYLEPADWWSLVRLLEEMVDLDLLLSILYELNDLLQLPGLPSELLEAPLTFLDACLVGELPREASGRRVGSRKLVKLARHVLPFLSIWPDAARMAVRSWADLRRTEMIGPPPELYFYEDWGDLLLETENLPPAVNGFSMMIAMTLMRWPERGEGLPIPADFFDPLVYEEVLSEWESLPDSPAVTEEGAGDAEALFAQGQMAYVLAQLGSVGIESSQEFEEADDARAYSQMSRAMLWLHNQCRHCPERDGVACNAATGWHEQPVPLLETSAEIANTGRIAGCIKMDTVSGSPSP